MFDKVLTVIIIIIILHYIIYNRVPYIKPINIQPVIDYNNLWENVWVINLDRDINRWDVTTQRLKQLDIVPKRWQATDARDQDVINLFNEFKKTNKLWNFPQLQRFNNVLTINEFACYLSHYRLILYLESIGVKNAIIFEDDIIIDPSITKQHIIDIINNSPGFNIIMLGQDDMFPFQHFSNEISRPGWSILAHAYIINDKSIRNLGKQLSDIKTKVDIEIQNYCKKNLCYLSHTIKNSDAIGTGIIHQDRKTHPSHLR